MSYDQIIVLIVSFIQNNDPAVIDTIPKLLLLVEQEICDSISNIGLIQSVTDNDGFVPGQSIVEKPGGWRRNEQFQCFVDGIQQELELIDISILNVYLKKAPTGVPRYYADADINNWAVAPIPDDNYPFSVRYAGLPQPLSPENQYNYFSSFIPYALVYGTLLKCQGPYLKNPELVPIWENIYKSAISSVSTVNTKRIVDSSNDRIPG